VTHHHSGDVDHDDDVVEPLESNPIWQQDNVTLQSVGIDIGSSGTQVVFSRLQMRRRGEDLTSRYVVVARDRLFESEVSFTPYTDDLLIDAVELGSILDKAYVGAGRLPEDVDTGVVILTGEALRRLNAELISSVVSERAGDLVCASAGHHMEAMLAAYGSGAVRRSHEDGTRILNVDIGGGTTKLALLERGRVLGAAAVHIGGRLLVVDEAGALVRLEPAGRAHAAACGFALDVGDRVEGAVLDAVADAMAEGVLAAFSGSDAPQTVRDLFLTEPVEDVGRVDGVVFSGGVSEYVYDQETRDFGDLGRRLGASLRRRVLAGALPGPLLPAAERIRATVLGASEHSVQLSGITSFLPSPDRTLPRRNLPVLRPSYELDAEVSADDIAEAVTRHLTAFGAVGGGDDVAVALSWSGSPEYGRVRPFAEGVRRGMDGIVSSGRTLYLMLDADLALTLGRILRDDLGVDTDMVILDGLDLRDFDYVDLGRVRNPSHTVPVTIKSLVFGGAP
jgi:ethanolamine utilization protein EutA